MKNVLGLKKTLIASTIAAASVVAPSMAAAEISGSLGIASMYLWRGQDVSAGTANVSGSLDFTTDAGFYVGTWISSAGTAVAGGTTSTETDFYVGFGGEAGGLSYDLSYITYVYPEFDVGAGELGEIILGLGMGGFSATLYSYAGWEKNISDGGDGSTDMSFGDDNYVTLGYDYEDFGILVGTWMYEADDSDYTHVDLSYSPIENLTFTVSKVVDSDKFSPVSDDQDPLFVVGYSFPL
jgi:uncharacterized protein (TIGR02001 family)